MASSKMDMEFKSRIQEVVNMEMEQAKKRVTEMMVVEIEQTTKHLTERIFEMLNLSGTSLNFPVETSQGIGYQLVFANKLPSTIFTDTKIEAEMGVPIKIALVDTIRKAVVTSGPLSSMKIKIVALDGDLGFDYEGNWTEQQFDAKVVREKKDKRPLVIGDVDGALEDGVVTFNDLKFTDNSSWMKSGKFRLSARVVGGLSRIKEAISNDVQVKESRGKGIQKKNSPSLDDEVWRLVEIAKDGKRHERLAAKRIEKVRDFWQMYKDNPKQLKDILHCSAGQWGKIVENASRAVDGHNCQPPAKCLRIQSQNDQPYDLTSLQAKPISTPTAGLQHPEFPVAQQSVQVYNHPIQPPDFTCGDPNARMEGGLQATCEKATFTNLACGLTSPGPMSTLFPVSANLSSRIEEPLVQSQNHQPYYLPSLQAGPLSTPTAGMCMGSYEASTSSSYKVGLGDHNHQLPLPVEKNNHPIQPSDRTCEDYNIRMDGLQPTGNEETITNLANGKTSQDPMATEETVPSLADGTTSQAPTTTCPVTALCEQTNDVDLHLIDNDSESVDAERIDAFDRHLNSEPVDAVDVALARVFFEMDYMYE